MLLNKPILLIKFATTELDFNILEPIELGAILLSNEDLSEKSRYHTDILATKPLMADVGALKIAQKTYQTISTQGIPLEDAVQGLEKAIFTDNQLSHNQVYLCSWNNFHVRVLKEIFYKTGLGQDFDFQVIDMQSLAFAFRIMLGKAQNGLAGFGSALKDMDIEAPYKRTAIQDCELQTVLLRNYFSIGMPSEEDNSIKELSEEAK